MAKRRVPSDCTDSKRTRAETADGGEDISVIFDDEAATEILTHSQVLILASPVFKKMLTHEMIEKKSHRIELPGKCPNEFKALLRFLQPGTSREQKISGQNVEFLVRWCDEYCIDALKNECIQFIKKQKPSMNRLVQAHCLGLTDTVEKDIQWFVGRRVKDWSQCYPHPELVQKVLEAVVRTQPSPVESDDSFEAYLAQLERERFSRAFFG